MDKPSLKALRELHENATPGPWHPDPTDYALYIFGPDKQRMVAEMRGHGSKMPQEENMALIVALRNALPALLAIAEAVIADRKAQEAVSRACLDDMDSEEAQAAFQQGHDADKALAAAIALVEE